MQAHGIRGLQKISWKVGTYLSSFMKRFFSRSNSLALTEGQNNSAQSRSQRTVQVYERIQNAQLDRLCMSSMNCDAT